MEKEIKEAAKLIALTMNNDYQQKIGNSLADELLNKIKSRMEPPTSYQIERFEMVMEAGLEVIHEGSPDSEIRLHYGLEAPVVIKMAIAAADIHPYYIPFKSYVNIAPGKIVYRFGEGSEVKSIEVK